MLKIFLITIVVSFVTVYLPILNEINAVPFLKLVYQFTIRCLFIFSITIPFDIRDMEYDKKDGLITIPTYFGVQGAKRIALSTLVVMNLICFLNILYLGDIESYEMIGVLLSSVLSGYVIIKVTSSSSEFYYSLVIEGMMVAQFGLVFLSKFALSFM